MGARPYDAKLGRFLAVDPIDGGSLNVYDYAFQDPINVLDLDGRCPSCNQRAGSWNVSRGKIATARASVRITEDGIRQTLDKHGKDWFGRKTYWKRDRNKWGAMVNDSVTQGLPFDYTLPRGKLKVPGFVKMIEGRAFVVFFKKSDGKIAGARGTGGAQLAKFNRLAREFGK